MEGCLSCYDPLIIGGGFYELQGFGWRGLGFGRWGGPPVATGAPSTAKLFIWSASHQLSVELIQVSLCIDFGGQQL